MSSTTIDARDLYGLLDDAEKHLDAFAGRALLVALEVGHDVKDDLAAMQELAVSLRGAIIGARCEAHRIIEAMTPGDTAEAAE